MITAVNSINNNQNYVNFEGRGKKISAKRIKKGFCELPYTLGLKKKKSFWEKPVVILTLGALVGIGGCIAYPFVKDYAKKFKEPKIELNEKTNEVVEQAEEVQE